MKTGKLSAIQGYVAYTQSDRYRREDAAYKNQPGFITVNLILFIPFAIAVILFARKISTKIVWLRWVAVGALILAALVGFLPVLFFTTLAFYDPYIAGPPRPGGPWVDKYNRDMTVLVAGKLLGHQPADMWHSQLDEDRHLLANPEILLFADIANDSYLLVPAASVQQVRKIASEELQGAVSLEYDPNMVVVFMSNQYVASLANHGPFHEPGDGATSTMGPFEITLNTPRPHAIWFLRLNSREEKVSNDDFLARLRETLGPAGGDPLSK
jgi:hypothetical protein